jgi:hypothetical protein
VGFAPEDPVAYDPGLDDQGGLKRLVSARLEYCDFSGQHCGRGDYSRDAPIAIGHVRRDGQAARSADSHTFHAIEETVDERPPVDPDFGD